MDVLRNTSSETPLAVTLIASSATFEAVQEVDVDDNDTIAVPANTERNGLIVSNDKGGEDCYIAFNDTAVFDEKVFKLKKGESLLFDANSAGLRDSIHAICKNNKDTTIFYQEAI